MEKSSEKKRSQKRVNLKEIMRERLNLFQDWLYIGKPELMREYFSDLLFDEFGSDYFDKLSERRYREYINQNLPKKPISGQGNANGIEPQKTANDKWDRDCYFQSVIPDEAFEDSEIAKKYGEKLRELREEQRLSLEDVANYSGLSIQNIQLIEAGKRKRIDRCRLLLFCGVYQVPPEYLLGFMELKGTMPIEYMSKETSTKVDFILNSLVSKDEELLFVFYKLALEDVKIRKKAISFLSNIPILKVFTPLRALRYIEEHKDQAKQRPKSVEVKPQQDNWKETGNFILSGTAALADLDKQTPILLNVFVSIIASPEETRKAVVQILKLAGFVTDGIPANEENV